MHSASTTMPPRTAQERTLLVTRLHALQGLVPRIQGSQGDPGGGGRHRPRKGGRAKEEAEAGGSRAEEPRRRGRAGRKEPEGVEGGRSRRGTPGPGEAGGREGGRGERTSRPGGRRRGAGQLTRPPSPRFRWRRCLARRSWRASPCRCRPGASPSVNAWQGATRASSRRCLARRSWRAALRRHMHHVKKELMVVAVATHARGGEGAWPADLGELHLVGADRALHLVGERLAKGHQGEQQEVPGPQILASGAAMPPAPCQARAHSRGGRNACVRRRCLARRY